MVGERHIATALLVASGAALSAGCTNQGSEDVEGNIPPNQIVAMCEAAATEDIENGVTAQESLDKLGPSLLANGGSGPYIVSAEFAKDPNNLDGIKKEYVESLPANPAAISLLGGSIIFMNDPIIAGNFIDEAVTRGGNNYLPENKEARIKECVTVLGALMTNSEIGDYVATSAISTRYEYVNGKFTEVVTQPAETREAFSGLAMRSAVNKNVKVFIDPRTGELITIIENGGQANDDSEAQSSASPSPDPESTASTPAGATGDQTEEGRTGRTAAPVPSGRAQVPGTDASPSTGGRRTTAPGTPEDEGTASAPGNPQESGTPEAPGNPQESGTPEAPGTPSEEEPAASPTPTRTTAPAPTTPAPAPTTPAPAPTTPAATPSETATTPGPKDKDTCDSPIDDCPTPTP